MGAMGAARAIKGTRRGPPAGTGKGGRPRAGLGRAATPGPRRARSGRLGQAARAPRSGIPEAGYTSDMFFLVTSLALAADVAGPWSKGSYVDLAQWQKMTYEVWIEGSTLYTDRWSDSPDEPFGPKVYWDIPNLNPNHEYYK